MLKTSFTLAEKREQGRPRRYNISYIYASLYIDISYIYIFYILYIYICMYRYAKSIRKYYL